ncbi:NACHT domain-containing protein [Aeromonas hydrophila]|uniref:NACHT domain-containing protein n=1 Tax=Aeromonas hydrophila TaxID=644 RepID=UPI003F7A799D
MELKIEEIIQGLVKDLASSVIEKTVSIGERKYNELLVDFEFCFSKYLERSYDRYRKIKTLLYRDRPVELKNHHVPTDYTFTEEVIYGLDIIDRLITSKNSIIVGTAGSGKSVLLRRMFLELIEKRDNIVPIIIELRYLTSKERDYSIIDYLYKTLNDLSPKFTLDQLEYSLQSGKLTLLLDGYDEIDFSKREKYEREILDISNKYNKTCVVLSSRPDDCFSSWDEYSVYHALSLNKEQAIELISKIDYDKTIKDKFIKELDGGLYEKHNDFLSSPLLLTMMLLTYEQLAEIPEKIHIFYEQAFDTLFHKHDALKSLYKRRSYSELPIDSFKRIFSVFCIITFSNRNFSFEYNQLISYIKQALEIEGVDVNPTSYFNDLIKSVCIIQRDGNLYTFSHRSFQEYFSAYFLSNSNSIDIGAALDKICKNNLSDNVINMLFDLNREKIETEWILPRLTTIIEKSNGMSTTDEVLIFASILYDDIAVIGNGIGLMLSSNLPLGYFISTINSLYPSEMDEIYPNQPDLTENEGLKGKELAVFKKNTAHLLDRANTYDSSVNIKKLIGNSSWITDTWIYENMFKTADLCKLIHSNLSDKYEKKKDSLSAILFKKT